jgi:hypothetical protein
MSGLVKTVFAPGCSWDPLASFNSSKRPVLSPAAASVTSQAQPLRLSVTNACWDSSVRTCMTFTTAYGGSGGGCRTHCKGVVAACSLLAIADTTGDTCTSRRGSGRWHSSSGCQHQL